ncbi:TetR/AcrR family transcriptional regulator [Leucobacter chinensis]|uniref:TetR/AcrR family transcriptional regulator n=1 Tax=Leucobacter chinensis TaxID=2851010 RepID=UPI001C238E02|nr:TetR/AcrR family transcriptional regulator [Leucobacter chinensis]
MARQAKPFAKEREQLLFAAAAEEFTAHGYERASLNRMLERSGVAKSSFYHFYADKAGLFDALVRRYRGDLNIDSVEMHAVAMSPKAEALDRIASWLSKLAVEQPTTLMLGRLLALPDAPATPAVTDFGAAVMRAVARILASWRARGEVSAELPLQLHMRSLLAVLRVADEWVIERGLEPRSVAQALTLLKSVL